MMTMALLALLALVAPSFVWACPITGRTGSAATVCAAPTGFIQGAAKAAGIMPCCAHMQAPAQASGATCLGVCCKSVPQLPQSDQDRGTPPIQAHADTLSVLAHLAKATLATLLASALPPAPLAVEPPQGLAFHNAAASSTPPLAQHAPSASAGRAPPLA